MAEQPTDHDLLIELRTEFKGMREDIKTIKDNSAIVSEDHETRIRSLEKSVWTSGGIASGIGIVAGYIWSYFT